MNDKDANALMRRARVDSVALAIATSPVGAALERYDDVGRERWAALVYDYAEALVLEGERRGGVSR